MSATALRPLPTHAHTRTHTHAESAEREREICVGSASAAGNETNRGSACYATALTDVNVDADAAAGFDTLKLAVRRVASRLKCRIRRCSELSLETAVRAIDQRAQFVFVLVFVAIPIPFWTNSLLELLPICCVLYFLVLCAAFTSRCPR